jgi:3D (Asp-Asp-Asp) domain-containing protein
MKMLLYAMCLCLCSCAVDKGVDYIPKKVDIRTTAYCSSESDHIKYGNKSALGTTLKKGTIAADISVFPIGTKLKIDNNVYEVADYGSALVKSETSIPTVDIYTVNRSSMNRWGVRYFDGVDVIEWGSYDKSLKLLSDRLKYKHCRIMYERIQKKI